MSPERGNYRFGFAIAVIVPLVVLEPWTDVGTRAEISEFLVATDEYLPGVDVMFLLYVVAGLLASVITSVATAVLMIPVGVNAAAQLGANEFAFLSR